MPVYEFECGACGPFMELRPLNRASEPAQCPVCGNVAPKKFSVVNLRSMASKNRIAHERNERSANAPHMCGTGCSHERLKKPQPTDKKTGRPTLQSSSKRNRRPWMLGH